MGIFESVAKLISKGPAKPSAAPVPALDKAFLLEKLRQSELFKTLSPEKLAEIFGRMETISAAAGEVLIHEGAEGDYYYLLMTGVGQVKRQGAIVAEIGEPFGFGEEALISNAKRNATVVMKTAGSLMRISKDQFGEFIRDVFVSWLSPIDAQERVAKGARWIDVREAGLTKEGQLPGSLGLPIEKLREEFDKLPKNVAYICYCDNGRTSATAAFLMKQRGFDVYVLRGGVKSLKRAGIA